MSASYFWDGKQVITSGAIVSRSSFTKRPALNKLLYCECFNTGNHTTGTRSGMWENEGGGWLATVCWRHIPLEELSSEFRAHLLLLGVS